MAEARVAAIDLGASSGRVVIGHRTDQGFSLREVHRFPNRPRAVGGVVRWDARALFAGVRDGLRAAAAAGPVDAVSVDGWAVDYGLLDGDGELIADPACYRDPRTGPSFSAVSGEGGVNGVDAARLYAATGVAAQPINTVFQLMAERGSAALSAARHAVLVPDLISYWLSGWLGTELTNASTTGLLDTRTMTWAHQAAEALGVPVDLFPRLRAAGETAGPMTASLAAGLGLTRPPQVITGPSHDTAAAVAGIPADDDAFAFVCTGTWALAGVELPAPMITEAAREAGFSNEAGVDVTTRFLRNMTGFWLLQECAREWRADGQPADLDALTRAASQIPGQRALIDVQEPDFLPPGGMTERITRACRRTSGVSLSGHAEVMRCILDSMAVAIRHAIRDAVRITARPVRTVHVVGGGVANPLFCQLVADACGLPVVAGPTEAASWGNALVQARALGVIAGSLPELRSLIRRGVRPATYLPGSSEKAWERASDIVLSSRAARSA
ncbi:MAG TPA: rhamnulokinase family protein [Streptosporangiaceae bacterium]|nr:rhamnulokinase family protein [Streptosporangiaceae bacterium]